MLLTNPPKGSNAWNLDTAPPNTKCINSGWLFKAKHDNDVNIEMDKARLVASGSLQICSMDYDETFLPVARFTNVLLH